MGDPIPVEMRCANCDRDRRYCGCDPACAALEQQLTAAQERENPDMTNAQYHAQLDRLWSVLPARDKGTNVFDLAVETVLELRARNATLEAVVSLVRDIDDDPAWSGLRDEAREGLRTALDALDSAPAEVVWRSEERGDYTRGDPSSR